MKLSEVPVGAYFTHLKTGKNYKLLEAKTIRSMGTQYFCLNTGTGQKVRLHHSCSVALVTPPDESHTETRQEVIE